MRGDELQEFFVQLESRFPDLRWSSESLKNLSQVEREFHGVELDFGQVWRILGELSGHSRDKNDTSPSSPLFVLSKDDSTADRLSQLEGELVKAQKEAERYRIEAQRREQDLSNAFQRINELENSRSMAKEPAGAAPEGQQAVYKANVEKLKRFCGSLLNTTELLLKERSQLYEAHLHVLQGGKVSGRRLAQRMDIEHDLMQVYSGLQSSATPTFEDGLGSLGCGIAPGESIMSRPRSFVVYSFLIWISGVLTAFFAYQYLAESDVLLSIPMGPVPY